MNFCYERSLGIIIDNRTEIPGPDDDNNYVWRVMGLQGCQSVFGFLAMDAVADECWKRSWRSVEKGWW